MSKQTTVMLICIACPLGCEVEVHKEDGEFKVQGNKCKNGIEYAIQELTNPMRTITSTVKTSFPDFPRIPVKTSDKIPMKDIFKFMKVINKMEVTKRLTPGDIIENRIAGSDIDLIATADMSSISE